MQCPKCKAKGQTGNFCAECGAKLTRAETKSDAKTIHPEAEDGPKSARAEATRGVKAADSVEASASSLDSADALVSSLASAEDSVSSLASVEVAVSSSWLLFSSEVAVSALPEAVDCVSLLLPQAAQERASAAASRMARTFFLRRIMT